MQLVRFAAAGHSYPQVGVLEDGTVTTLPMLSVADLLREPLARIRSICRAPSGRSYAADQVRLLPPVDGRMEVWAAGVTYKTSELGRVKESHSAPTVYELVYEAERPELFYKSAAWRVVGDGEPIAVRSDSTIDVPEPELALVLNCSGEIAGYSICDDVSSRSIEGENPLYLPQAKSYLGGCAVGPGIRPAWELPDPYRLGISLHIARGGLMVWQGQASTTGLKRSLDDLVAYLLRADVFPDGVVLSTGTCLVPELPFSLEQGDTVEIQIEGIGRLTNPVVRGRAGAEWLSLDASRRGAGPAAPGQPPAG